jgi:hydroxymethylpyrimidine/phosphomethylpyrimidine kinase
VLTIAGSDSGGGAGIQADLKTFAAHGVYGLCAVTAVTAQNTVEVRAVAEVPAAVVAAQIDAVLDDFGAGAVKIGMLWSAATVRAVAARLRARLGAGAGPSAGGRGPAGRAGGRRVPIVLDPVLAAGSGASLLAADGAEALAALVEELLPLATLVTPNLPELARLAAALPGPEPGPVPGAGDAPVPAPAPSPAVREQERLRLARRLAALGPAVLAKGGHDLGPADEEVVDLLLIPAGPAQGAERVVRYSGRRLPARAAHGTGCTLSAAIAARLAAGEELAAAVGGAVEYVRRAMAAAPPLGAGSGPLAHVRARRQRPR